MSKVPDCREYMNVDELNASSEKLAKEQSEVVKVLDLGRSAGGDPIKCLKIGEGKYHALVYGFPNSEEPVGGLLLDYFSRALAEDRSLLRELDYTWYLVKCIDPDGARLNSGFLKGPLTPLNFAKNYYRAPAFLCGEANFPFRYGDLDLNSPLPETKALMKIMDRTRLDFISSHHNMKWGGITYQVSEPCPSLYAPLQEVAKAHRAFPRKRLGTMLAAGIQLAEYLTPVRNYVRASAAGKGPLQEITGAFTFEYALLSNSSVFMMIPECSLWYDERCWDDRLSNKRWAEVVAYEGQVGSETSKFLLSLYEKAEPLLESHSPHLEMIRSLIKRIRSPTLEVLDPGPEIDKKQLERLATVAEMVETEGRADIYRMFNLGGMIRMFNHELAQRGGSNDILRACRADAEAKLEEWNQAFDKKYECKAHPIRNLVGMSLGSILYSAEYAKRKASSL
jgi:hypothetical protein